METKPFSLQSPEQIAKDYAGNKQMIAHAAQQGFIDPTAAVLAGMFIDRARTAQAGSGPSGPTVAQQVFASPQARPMAPQQPSLGMAEGGLTTLNVPETIFDEPSNGGYAGGGIVAFAAGGASDQPEVLYKYFGEFFNDKGWRVTPKPGDMFVDATHAGSSQLKPKAGATPQKIPFSTPNVSRETTQAAPSAAPPQTMAGVQALFGGQPPSQGLTNAFSAINAPVQAPMPTNPFAGIHTPPPAGASQIAAPTAGLPDLPRRPLATPVGLGATAPAQAAAPPAPDTTISVPQAPQAPDLNTSLQSLQGMVGAQGGPATDAYKAYLAATPERLAKQKKEDLWATLAQIGFGMAGSNSPYALQAAGQAATAAIPGMQKAIESQRADQQQAIKDSMGLETQARQEKIQEISLALNQYDTAIKAYTDAGQLKQAAEVANQRADVEKRAQDMGLLEHREDNKTSLQVAGINAGASASAAKATLSAAQSAAIIEKATTNVDNRLFMDDKYRQLVKKNPAKAQQQREQMIQDEANMYQSMTNGARPTAPASTARVVDYGSLK